MLYKIVLWPVQQYCEEGARWGLETGWGPIMKHWGYAWFCTLFLCNNKKKINNHSVFYKEKEISVFKMAQCSFPPVSSLKISENKNKQRSKLHIWLVEGMAVMPKHRVWGRVARFRAGKTRAWVSRERAPGVQSSQRVHREKPSTANWEPRETHRPAIFARSSLPMKRCRETLLWGARKLTVWIACGYVDTKKPKPKQKTNGNKTTNKQNTSLAQNPMSEGPHCKPDTLEISSLFYEISAISWCKRTDYPTITNTKHQ